MLDEDLRAALAPLVGGEVYPLRRPQSNDGIPLDVLPVIVYTPITEDWQLALTLCGPGLSMSRYQFDVYASHYRETRNLAYAVAAVLDDNNGWRMNMKPFPDDDEKLYRWMLEYEFGRNEEPQAYFTWRRTRK